MLVIAAVDERRPFAVSGIVLLSRVRPDIGHLDFRDVGQRGKDGSCKGVHIGFVREREASVNLLSERELGFAELAHDAFVRKLAGIDMPTRLVIGSVGQDREMLCVHLHVTILDSSRNQVHRRFEVEPAVTCQALPLLYFVNGAVSDAPQNTKRGIAIVRAARPTRQGLLPLLVGRRGVCRFSQSLQ